MSHLEIESESLVGGVDGASFSLKLVLDDLQDLFRVVLVNKEAILGHLLCEELASVFFSFTKDSVSVDTIS